MDNCFYLTESERKGFVHEKCVDQTFKKLGGPVESNPFDPVEWKRSVGKGVDHMNNEILVEDKNFNPCYPITPRRARDEILSRFPPIRSDNRTRILVITSLDLRHNVIELLRRANIHIVFLPYQVSEENYEETMKILMSRLSVLLRILHSVHYNPLGVFIIPIDPMLNYIETTSDLIFFINLFENSKSSTASLGRLNWLIWQLQKILIYLRYF